MDAVMTDHKPLLARVENGVGRLTLNRPEALHALTTDMCRIMTEALSKWAMDETVRYVVLDHAGGRGFCSGPNIASTP